MEKTIVMIHGMWGGGWCWDHYKPFLENKGYHCITPILRYHDRDPNDEPDPRLGTVSLTDYADDLEKQIRKLDVPVILMGHSMGGASHPNSCKSRSGRSGNFINAGNPIWHYGAKTLCNKKLLEYFDDLEILEKAWKADF